MDEVSEGEMGEKLQCSICGSQQAIWFFPQDATTDEASQLIAAVSEFKPNLRRADPWSFVFCGECQGLLVELSAADRSDATQQAHILPFRSHGGC